MKFVYRGYTFQRLYVCPKRTSKNMLVYSYSYSPNIMLGHIDQLIKDLLSTKERTYEGPTSLLDNHKKVLSYRKGRNSIL